MARVTRKWVREWFGTGCVGGYKYMRSKLRGMEAAKAVAERWRAV